MTRYDDFQAFRARLNERITGEVLDLDPDHGLIVRRDTGEIITLPAATTSVIR